MTTESSGASVGRFAGLVGWGIRVGEVGGVRLPAGGRPWGWDGAPALRGGIVAGRMPFLWMAGAAVTASPRVAFPSHQPGDRLLPSGGPGTVPLSFGATPHDQTRRRQQDLSRGGSPEGRIDRDRQGRVRVHRWAIGLWEVDADQVADPGGAAHRRPDLRGRQ